MVFRDTRGQVIKEGDFVAVSLSIAEAKILKLSSGLGLEQTKESVPMAVLSIVVTVGVMPNGFVPGIMKIPDSESGNLDGST